MFRCGQPPAGRARSPTRADGRAAFPVARRQLFPFARPFRRLRVVVHDRPGGYELGAVRQTDLPARVRRRRPAAAGARGRQTPRRHRERVRDAVRRQHGRTAAAAVAVTVVRVRRVRPGRRRWRRAAVHHVRPVAGHRDAGRRHVGRSGRRRVLGAVRRAARAHDGRAPGAGRGYAAGASDRHAAASHHQPLDLRPRVAVVFAGRRPLAAPAEFRLFRRRRRHLIGPRRSQQAFLFVGRVPARPFQSRRPVRPVRVAVARRRRRQGRTVSANVRGRPVLDDLGKRVHHRLKRVVDQYREVIGPRRRPFDPRRPVNAAAAVHSPVRVRRAGQHRVSDDLAPDRQHLRSLLRRPPGNFAVRVPFAVQVVQDLTDVRVDVRSLPARRPRRRSAVVVAVVVVPVVLP